MNIKILEKSPNIKVELLNYLKRNNKIFNFKTKLTDKENKKIDVIIIRSKIIVDENLLNKYPNLKYVARVGVGLDKIDIEECKKRGIKVLNTPGANADSVADLVIAGTLNLARKLNQNFAGLENRFNYLGTNIGNKSVGIIGFGNIGKKVYERFKGFGVNKFYIYDPFLKREDVEKNKFCTFIENKENLFSNSDIITFHIPLLKQTRNFLGENEFKLLKKDVILINTSRGGIINENILINFLKNNKDSGFFADVWEEENIGKNPKKELLTLTNSIITPHIGAMTKESEKNMYYFKELE